MVESTGTRYSQLTESLAPVKHNQELYQANHNSLQQVVDGLAQQLQRVAANVETLVTNSAKQHQKMEGSNSQLVNPLYEEQHAIHTIAVWLNFPNSMELTQWVGYIVPISFLLTTGPILTLECFWRSFIWMARH